VTQLKTAIQNINENADTEGANFLIRDIELTLALEIYKDDTLGLEINIGIAKFGGDMNDRKTTAHSVILRLSPLTPHTQNQLTSGVKAEPTNDGFKFYELNSGLFKFIETPDASGAMAHTDPKPLKFFDDPDIYKKFLEKYKKDSGGTGGENV